MSDPEVKIQFSGIMMGSKPNQIMTELINTSIVKQLEGTHPVTTKAFCLSLADVVVEFETVYDARLDADNTCAGMSIYDPNEEYCVAQLTFDEYDYSTDLLLPECEEDLRIAAGTCRQIITEYALLDEDVVSLLEHYEAVLVDALARKSGLAVKPAVNRDFFTRFAGIIRTVVDENCDAIATQERHKAIQLDQHRILNLRTYTPIRCSSTASLQSNSIELYADLLFEDTGIYYHYESSQSGVACGIYRDRYVPVVHMYNDGDSDELKAELRQLYECEQADVIMREVLSSINTSRHFYD